MQESSVKHNEPGQKSVDFWKTVVFLVPLFGMFFIFYSGSLFYKAFISGEGAGLLQVQSGGKVEFEPLLAGVDRNLYAKGTTSSYRLNWTTFANIHLLICIVAFLTALLILYQTYAEHGIRHPWLLSILGAGGIALSVLIVAGGGELSGLVKNVLVGTVGLEYRYIADFNASTDGFAFVTAVLLAVTSSIILIVPPNRDPNAEERLQLRMRQQRMILYVGTLVLVSNILSFSWLVHWAAAYVPPSGNGPDMFHELVNGLVNARALYLTLVLLAIYLPGAFYLRQCAIDLARSRNPRLASTKLEEWLRDRGLQPTAVGQIPSVVALLSPLLSGTAGELLKFLQR